MSRAELRKHPQLGPVLKALRRRVSLEQRDVASAVSMLRGPDAKPMTADWYAKLENRPNAYPRDSDLDHILAVLGSSRQELVAILSSPQRIAQMTDPDAASRGQTTAWSSPVHAAADTPPAGSPGRRYGALAPTPRGVSSRAPGPRALRGAAFDMPAPPPSQLLAGLSAPAEPMPPLAAAAPALDGDGPALPMTVSAPDERELVEAYRALPEDAREDALRSMRSRLARARARGNA